MSLKGLIFSEDAAAEKASKEKNKPKPSKQIVKFPDAVNSTEPETDTSSGFNFNKPSNTSFTPITFNKNVPDEFLNKAIETYKNGFDSLNQPGYDFYEYYQSVMEGGPSVPQVYAMAFKMGVTMDRTITKDKLTQQADFYVGKITDVYNDYITKGNNKKLQLTQQKESENQSLTNDLTNLKQQLETIETQINDRQSKLKAIDSKYQPQLNDIDSKLAANDIAKNQLVNSIEQVKNGINNNVK